MTTFTDDFNRADGSVGAGWVQVSGTWVIVSNQLSPGTTGGTVLLRAATAMATSDNYAQVTIAATTPVSQGVWCRGDSTLTSGYAVRNNGTNWALFSVVGGTFTSIGTFAAAAVAGDVVKIQAVGSTIKVLINGVERINVSNSAVASGTTVGIRSEANTGLRFDSFSSGDVTSGTTGDAALSGTATLSATGTRAASGASALAATATLTASGLRATAGDAASVTTATLTADGTRSTTGAASLIATVTLAADGTKATAGDAALTTTAGLTATGQRTAAGDTALAAFATITAAGQRATATGADLAAAAELAADGVRIAQGDAGLAATADLTAQGQIAHSGAVALTATAALTASGDTATTGGAGIAVSAVLTAAGTTLTTRDDVDVTVGAPYSPWAASAPRSDRWTVDVLVEDWGVGAPW